MYYVSKRIEIAFAHKLTLDYESKCTKLHGHNAIVTVFCCSGQLNSNGMVVDFKHIKETVTSQLDHGYGYATRYRNAIKWCSRNPKGILLYM